MYEKNRSLSNFAELFDVLFSHSFLSFIFTSCQSSEQLVIICVIRRKNFKPHASDEILNFVLEIDFSLVMLFRKIRITEFEKEIIL